MRRLVEFPSENGEIILVEVEEPEWTSATRGGRSLSDVTERAKITFEEALDKAQPVAAALIEKLRSLEPDEATVEFGLKLSAQAGAVLAAAGTEAHYKVTLKWNKPPSE